MKEEAPQYLSEDVMAMAAVPSLPELRFAEIPATLQPRYTGDRFC